MRVAAAAPMNTGSGGGAAAPFRRTRRQARAPSTAALNQPVMDVGCVMAVPTMTAKAPAPMAAAASPGVWTRPSQITGTPGNSWTMPASSSKSGPSVFPRSPV